MAPLGAAQAAQLAHAVANLAAAAVQACRKGKEGRGRIRGWAGAAGWEARPALAGTRLVPVQC